VERESLGEERCAPRADVTFIDRRQTDGNSNLFRFSYNNVSYVCISLLHITTLYLLDRIAFLIIVHKPYRRQLPKPA
jgi:hypothetical protein